jgi:hypothetical protein
MRTRNLKPIKQAGICKQIYSKNCRSDFLNHWIEVKSEDDDFCLVPPALPANDIEEVSASATSVAGAKGPNIATSFCDPFLSFHSYNVKQIYFCLSQYHRIFLTSGTILWRYSQGRITVIQNLSPDTYFDASKRGGILSPLSRRHEARYGIMVCPAMKELMGFQWPTDPFNM